MQADRKNMERMEEHVVDTDHQQLQHMLTDAQWDHQAVMDHVASDCDGLLGGSAESGLLVDESSFAKKGKNSVAVARQWSGRQGKIDNCQVAVYTALARGREVGLLSGRLYLPREWIESPSRCRKAGIPKEEIRKQSKVEIALEMVQHHRQQGVRFSWVGADAGYGKDPAFLRSLEKMGETFVVDVHKDQRIFLQDPEPSIPPSKNSMGRKPSRRVSAHTAVRVDQWLKQQPEDSWQTIRLRKGEKGELRAQFIEQQVWLWNKKEARARQWRLLVRREIDAPNTLHFTLTNAPQEIRIDQLARMQGQRFWVERAFQNAKSECGMADYQVRKWSAWYHHMALCLMAQQFMLQERILQKDSYPLLSHSDIEHLLRTFLPRRNSTPDEVVRQIEVRHRKRKQATESAYAKQSLDDQLTVLR